MSTTVEEFRELLTDEVHLDMDKLRSAARHGIPDEIRGEVWKYLLGVQTLDKSQEISNIKAKYAEYLHYEKENNEIMKRVRGEAARYQRSRSALFKTKDLSSVLENVISAYINRNRNVDYFPALIHLCGPFVHSLSKESEIYYSFEKLMNQIDDHFSNFDVSARLANFLMLFRTLLPDVYNHFEDEEVDNKEWSTSWCQYLLAKELPLECVLRLWDTYFSVPDGLNLHVYVCLAILQYLKETLEESEQSEIRAVLLRLPLLDMDQIISQAFNLKTEVLERQLSELP